MNLEGWEIDVDSLPGPKRGSTMHMRDAIYPSPDGKHAVVLHTITEIRMGWDVGIFALFANRANPKPILTPVSFRCCHTEDAVIWLTDNMFAVKKHCYDSVKDKLSVPFALIDLAQGRYSFIRLTNSYSYGLSFDGANFRLIERRRDTRFASHNDEFRGIAALPWYDLTQLEDFDIHYAGYTA